MKQKLKPIVLSLCFLSVISLPAFADSAVSADSTSNISAKTEELQRQLNQIQNEMRSLKSQLRQQHKVATRSVSGPVPIQQKPLISNTTNDAGVTPGIAGLGGQYMPVDIDVPGQSFVSSGPYIGVPLAYSGGNLIINSPSINQDVSLLRLRKKIIERLHDLGRASEADHAHLLLSGTVEGAAMYKTSGNGPSSNDIDLTNVGLDGYILGPSTWTSALFTFSYDNDAGSSTGTFNNNSRSQNSRLFVNQAFIVLGDFTQSPLYGTIGQYYVPFGTFSSNMVSSPVTKMLARTKARALSVGFQQQSTDALYAAAYVFKGDSYTGSTSRISNGGINFGYRYAYNDIINGDFGGGVIRNIADSQGMQNTGNSPFFGGFGGVNNSGKEQISHQVPAIDLRGLFSVGGSIDLLAEYIGAVQSFSTSDMTLNSHGARPRAFNVEAAYTFKSFVKPTSVAIGYGKTKDALAIGLPLARYALTVNTSFWKDTIESLEFRHDVNYAASNVATGSNIAVYPASGKSDNCVTAQFDIYF